MNTKCETCQHTFCNRGNYLRHIRTSITCTSENDDKSQPQLKCIYCDKKFALKGNLNKHFIKCPQKQNIELKSKYKAIIKEERCKFASQKKKCKLHKEKILSMTKELEELKEELSEQKGIIEGMKNAPDKKTIYNTAYVHPKLVNLPINNIPALTQEYMIEKVNDGILTYEKAVRGYPGILEVIGELITHENDEGEIERNYVCTDVSRNSFHRLLESKKWKPDKGGRYLNNMLDTFRNVMEEYKNRAYDTYGKTPHESIEWGQVDWERKNISLLYSGIVSREGKTDREELVNILRKEISKRASV
jgi:hypothetical protein